MINTLFLSAALFASLAQGGLCGNGSPDPGEECDDGNTVPGDGCSATCQIDTDGWVCTPPVAGTPPVNLIGDGSFEQSNSNGDWSAIEHSLFGPNLICGASCGSSFSNFAADESGNLISGQYVILAGGSFSGPSTGFAEHTPMVLPNTATQLSFAWATLASGPAGNACAGLDDGITLSIDGLAVWSNLDGGATCSNVNPYDIVTIDLMALGLNDNTQHTIRFDGRATGLPPNVDLTNVMLDQVRVMVPAEDPQPPIPSICTRVLCGDGLQVGSEQCDDGNLDDGDGCSAACDIEQPNFVCEDALPPTDQSNVVSEGSFEKGPSPTWGYFGNGSNPICSQGQCGPTKAQSGAFYAWFGGSAFPTQQTLLQTLAIPSTATTLSFSLEITECDSADDFLAIRIDGTDVFVQTCDGALAAQTISVDVSAFADTTPQLRFFARTFETNGGTSSFFVDDVYLGDNLPFVGAPSVCNELPLACNAPEQFENGIPGDWTIINVGPNPDDGWGTTTDGLCGSQNWSGGNVTRGGGTAACADSDATGQIDYDNGGTALPMDTYLCTPSFDPSQAADPLLGFLFNYQSAGNSLNDNDTPGDPTDDFDDDFFELLVGTEAPDATTVVNYQPVTQLLDDLDTTLAFSQPTSIEVALSDVETEDEAYACFHYVGTYDWFAQVDNVALRDRLCEPDTDDDGVPDSVDNCTTDNNPSQLDTDGDGHGNRCDADFNDDCAVNAIDLGIFRTLFFQAGNEADLNGDGTASVTDLGIFRTLFFSTPGPSANGLCD